MKNHMVLSFFLIGAINTLLFTSCKKEDDSGAELLPLDNCRVANYTTTSNRESDADLYIEFSYDTDGNVIGRQHFSDDTLNITSVYERDYLGRLMRLEFLNSRNELYLYKEYQFIGESDIVSEYTSYSETNAVFYSVYYTYEEGTNRIVTDSSDWGAWGYERTYEYDDENHTRTILISKDGIYHGKKITTFDPELAYPLLKTGPLYYKSPSAIVSHESYDENDELEKNNSYTIAYDIDEEDQKIHMVYNYQSGKVSERIISYDCE
ncbi:MAG: hypothetical protein MI974_29185 [Chitinophagales bacterium]|nr:hypothetical protein [Chitinophagales bacterium]